MAKYPSTYYNNPVIGAAISNLSNAFFGPQLSAEKQAEADFYKSKTAGQLFENSGREGLAEAFKLDPRQAMIQGVAAGLPQMDDAYRAYVASNPNATQAEIDQAVQAGGGAFTGTAAGQSRTLATELAKQQMQGQSALAVQGLQNQGNMGVQGLQNEGSLAVQSKQNEGNALVQQLQNLMLNEGQIRTNPDGSIAAVGGNKLTPGQSLALPDRPIITAPYGPQSVAEGAQLIDPMTRQVIATGPQKLTPGQTLVSQGQAPYTAPYAPQNVPEGNNLVDVATGRPIATGNVSVPQGGSVYLQGQGTPLLGQAKPLGTDEVLGQALADNYPSQALGQMAASKTDPRVTNVKLPDGSITTGRETINGLVDAQTNQPLPPGTIKFGATVQGAGTDSLTNSTQSLVERQILAADQGYNLANQLVQIGQANPSALGTVGDLRGFMQNVINTGLDITGTLGPQAQELQKDILNGATEAGVQTFFDPAIGQVDLMINALAYSYAKASDPNGEVSVKGLQNALSLLNGGFMGSSRNVLNRIATVRDMMGKLRDDRSKFRPGVSGGLPNTPPVPVDPSLTTPLVNPGAGGAPTAPPAVENWARDPATGQLRRVQ